MKNSAISMMKINKIRNKKGGKFKRRIRNVKVYSLKR